MKWGQARNRTRVCNYETRLRTLHSPLVSRAPRPGRRALEAKSRAGTQPSRRTTLRNVKLATEDNPQEPDDYLALLSFLWKNEISINQNSIRNQLTIMGSSEPLVINWVAIHYSKLEHWLPGFCDGCAKWCIERTESFWGSHPHFCYVCLAWTIAYFEQHDRWPEGNWFPGETFTMEEE